MICLLLAAFTSTPSDVVSQVCVCVCDKRARAGHPELVVATLLWFVAEAPLQILDTPISSFIELLLASLFTAIRASDHRSRWPPLNHGR
jgi:hypothetical protein